MGRTGKSRGKIEIMADMLTLSMEGTRKTHLMFMANLSYEQVSYYLEDLQTKGFIEQKAQNDKVVYTTTKTGRGFLKSYSNVIQTLEGNVPKTVHEMYRQV